jgi:integrase
MTLWKRGRQYWMDSVVGGQRYREPLHTADWREAKEREKERLVELSRRPADPAHRAQSYGALDVTTAIETYARERRAQVSPRMVAYWTENARPLGAFFGTTALRHITPEQIAAYQNARTDAGRAPKTVNGELSVLRQVLRHARLWYRFQEDYRALKNTKLPVGQALTEDDQKRLFEAAKSRPEWTFAYVASALAFYCGLRACEIRGLQWKHVDWDHARIQIRRSKTPAGWRDPSLNDACARALKELRSRARTVGFDDPEHYLFPWHGRDKLRSFAADDNVALGLAIAAQSRRPRPRALPRRTPHGAHAPGRERSTRLGHPGADGSRVAGHDADLQSHPPQGARRSRGRAGAVLHAEIPATQARAEARALRR